MVNIQTIVFALVASTAGAKNLKVRGTTNVFTRGRLFVHISTLIKPSNESP